MVRIVVVPTEFKVSDLSFNYRVAKHSGRWSVLRWKLDAAPIPPNMQSLKQTVDGDSNWVSCCVENSDRVHWFDSLSECIRFATGCEADEIDIVEP